MYRAIRKLTLICTCGVFFCALPSQAVELSLLSENFESGSSSWTTTGDWQIGIPSSGPGSAIQGSRCAATILTGSYNNYTTSQLTSGAITIPAASQVTLSYYDWLTLETGADVPSVQISQDGISWSPLITGTYSSVWVRRTVDLTSYQNRSIRLRFSFTTDGSITYPGWYIDSISVVATVIDTVNSPRIAVAPATFSLRGAQPVTQQISICNDGRTEPLSYSINVTGGAGTPNIVSWTYGANLSGDYINVENAIYSKYPQARITRTTTTDSASLRLLLANASVFLIPRQSYLTPSYSTGLIFARVLADFVTRGGIVVILYPSAQSTFLSYAGLDSSSYQSYTSSSGNYVTVNAPSHPVFNNVSTSSLYTSSYQSYWTPIGTYTLLASYSSYATATVRRKGLGNIYTLGPDFYTPSASWSTILGNCIQQATTSATGISIDTVIGNIAAGTCKNINITFNPAMFTAGTYPFTVSVTHNAILRPSPIAIACTLSVDSAVASVIRPSLSVSLFTGDTIIRKISIINNGPTLVNLTPLAVSAGTSGHLRLTVDSTTVHAGDTANLALRFDATQMIDSGRYIDTLRVMHNARGVPNPMVFICTLSVASNIPVVIPARPDPTINRRPTLKWNKVAGARSYTLSVSSTPDFSMPLLLQQTADTAYTPLTDLPLGWKYWRVRTDLNMLYSHPDTFFVQKDSIPLLIAVTPDTVDGSQLVLRWHPANGAQQYRIELTRNDSLIKPVLISFTKDTAFPITITLVRGRYSWNVSADFDFNQTTMPDTFYSRGRPVGVQNTPFAKALPTDWGMKLAMQSSTRSASVIVSVPAGRDGEGSARRVSVELYNAQGKRLAVIVKGNLIPGISSHQVDLGMIGRGAYFMRLTAGGVTRAEGFTMVR